jgi:long-chain fatty acid transport protein
MKFRSLSLYACLGLVTAFCSISQKMEAIFASVKSTGMAATAIAYPQDSFAVAYNPAGMIAVGNRVDAEAGWLHDKGHAVISNNAFPIPPLPFPQINGTFDLMRTHDYYVGNFGVNTNWCTEISECYTMDWSFGVALYNRDFQKATQNKIQPLFGTSHPGIEYIHEELATSFAVSIYEGHSLGLSLDWHIARVKVNGLENFDTPTASSHPDHVTNRGYNYSNGLGVTLGYYGQLCDWLSVGATYRPRTKMHRYSKYDGFFAGRGRIDIPEKIGGGLAINYWPCWTFCFDVEYLRWHPIKALSNDLLPGILIPGALGTSAGAGFGFKNQTFYRLGIEYKFDDCWTVRAGYRHANSPTSKSQTAANTLIDDLVEDYVTVGFTWNWNSCAEISAFYAHGFEHKLNGKNAIPIYPFGGGNVSLKESKNVLGLAVGWKW